MGVASEIRLCVVMFAMVNDELTVSKFSS